MDEATMMAMFGGIDPMTGMPMPVPRAAIPQPPVVQSPPVVPQPVAPGMMTAGPAAPMPPVQGFEPTNTGNPMPPRPVEPYMIEPAPAPTPRPGTPGTLGAVLDGGVPMPRPRPAEAPGGTYAAQTAAGPAANASGIFNALKGVVAPPPPTAQKVSSPHAPAMAKLQGDNVATLLASLGIGPQQAFPGLKLPSTLGQALAGGR